MGRPIDDRKMWDAFVSHQVKSDKAIIEAYKRGEVTKQQLIEEGLWDRVKARGAGLKGSVKGIGNRIAGATKGAIAGAKGDIAGVQAGQEQQAAGKQQGLDAKSLSLVTSHLKNINKAMASFENDLSKLGLDPESIKATNPEAAAALTSIKTALSQVTNAFSSPTSNRSAAVNKLRNKVRPAVQPNPSTSTTPELDNSKPMPKLG